LGAAVITTMLRSIKDLCGYRVQATDGELGKVREFLFDDEYWMLRYMVADTGHWLADRKVLISPFAFDEPDWHSRKFPVRLTRRQIETSPGVESAMPVSRQKEAALHRHYGWSPYWGVTSFGESVPSASAFVSPARSASALAKADPHLRSTHEVFGYRLHASDGDIGHVDDFIVNDADWAIRYLVVDTHDWLAGKKVLISPWWVHEIRWEESRFHLGISRDAIRESPEYDFSRPVSRDYEDTLYEHYGKPKYWR
jgi:hypothetical protein